MKKTGMKFEITYSGFAIPVGKTEAEEYTSTFIFKAEPIQCGDVMFWATDKLELFLAKNSFTIERIEKMEKMDR